MAEAVQTESIMNLVRARAEAFGQLADTDLAKSKFSRDVIPSQASALPGVKKPQSSAQVGAVERNKLMNETRIVASVLAKMFPWMYQKPADAKGETKVLRKAEEQHNIAKENIKVAKSSKSRLGKIIGALAAGFLLWATFKDKIIELWNKHSGSLLEKIKWLGGKVLEGLKWLWDQIWPSIRPHFEWLGKEISNAWTKLKTWFGEKFLPMIADGLMWIAKGVDTLISTVLNIPAAIAGATAEKAVRETAETTAKVAGFLPRLSAFVVDHTVGLIPKLWGGERTRIGKAMDEGVQKIGGDYGEMVKRRLDKKGEEEGPGKLESMLMKSDFYKKRETARPPAGDPITEKVTQTAAKVKEKVSGIIPEHVLGGKNTFKPAERLYLETIASSSNPIKRAIASRMMLEEKLRHNKVKRPYDWGDGDHGMGPTDKTKYDIQGLPIQASVAKPFSGYRPTTIPGGDTSKTDDILTSSETLLHKIEQNTRGGMGNTVVNAGQRGGGKQRGSSPNTISPNTATVGAPKRDSRSTYLLSDYIERPNSMVT